MDKINSNGTISNLNTAAIPVNIAASTSLNSSDTPQEIQTTRVYAPIAIRASHSSTTTASLVSSSTPSASSVASVAASVSTIAAPISENSRGGFQAVRPTSVFSPIATASSLSSKTTASLVASSTSSVSTVATASSSVSTIAASISQNSSSASQGIQTARISTGSSLSSRTTASLVSASASSAAVSHERLQAEQSMVLMQGEFSEKFKEIMRYREMVQSLNERAINERQEANSYFCEALRLQKVADNHRKELFETTLKIGELGINLLQLFKQLDPELGSIAKEIEGLKTRSGEIQKEIDSLTSKAKDYQKRGMALDAEAKKSKQYATEIENGAMSEERSFKEIVMSVHEGLNKIGTPFIKTSTQSTTALPSTELSMQIKDRRETAEQLREAAAGLRKNGDEGDDVSELERQAEEVEAEIRRLESEHKQMSG